MTSSLNHANHTTSTLPRLASPSLVGVFDSGVGGLSVLRSLRKKLPSTKLLYVADSGHAPYGERSDHFVAQRTQRIASHLIALGASMLVIACNTATAVAISDLRKRWPRLPVVGVEPGLKPALAVSLTGRIGILATPTTLRSDKFQRLLALHSQGATISLQACPGLAGLIERGNLRDPALLQLIDKLCQPLRDANVDTVVLGCTHYPFVRAQIQAAMGNEVELIDTADAVAQQVSRILDAQPHAPASTSPVYVPLQTTGDVAHLQRLAHHWLTFECRASAALGL